MKYHWSAAYKWRIFTEPESSDPDFNIIVYLNDVIFNGIKAYTSGFIPDRTSLTYHSTVLWGLTLVNDIKLSIS